MDSPKGDEKMANSGGSDSSSSSDSGSDTDSDSHSGSENHIGTRYKSGVFVFTMCESTKSMLHVAQVP
jgi:hypothetical protein